MLPVSVGRGCSCLLVLLLAVGCLAFFVLDAGRIIPGDDGIEVTVLNPPTPTPELVPAGYVSEEFAMGALEQQRLASRDGFEMGAKIALAFGISDAAGDMAFFGICALCVVGMLFALVRMRG